jgi:uncharacterized cupredoxin-like copper-binding protein
MSSSRVAAIAAVLLLSSAGPSVQAQATGDTAVRVEADKDGVQRTSVLAGSYFFKPRHIVVKARMPVELSVMKEPGITPHDFVLQAPDAGIAVDAKLSSEPTKVIFTPTRPGKYVFYCSNKLPFMASHRERGMEGVIEVIE